MALKTITVSPSEIDCARQCPLKHKLTYHERWTKPAADDHPLGFGTLWHSVLEAHYRQIEQAQAHAQSRLGGWWRHNHTQTRQMAQVAANTVIAEVADADVRDLLNWMYSGHLAKWGIDPEWQIMAIEFPAEVDLIAPDGFKTDFEFKLKVKIDMVVKEQGRVIIIDHKSCKNLPKSMELDLDDQFGLYAWAMRQLGYPVRSLIHDAARKTRLKTKEAPLDERFLRTTLTRGLRELDTIALEAWQTAYSTYRDLFELQEFRRTSGIDIEPARRPQPNQCGWKCDWTNPCIMGRKGSDLRDAISRKGYRQDRSRH